MRLRRCSIGVFISANYNIFTNITIMTERRKKVDATIAKKQKRIMEINKMIQKKSEIYYAYVGRLSNERSLLLEEIRMLHYNNR